MDSRRISCLLLFVLSIAFLKGILLSVESLCPPEALVDLTTEIVENVSQAITINGSLSPSMAQSQEKRFFECPCLKRMCIPFCCPPKNWITPEKCVPWESEMTISLPPLYGEEIFWMNSSLIESEYHRFVWDPCTKYKDNKHRIKTILLPDDYEEDSFFLLNNGSIYLPFGNEIMNINDYCFGHVKGENYNVVYCPNMNLTTPLDNSNEDEIPISYRIGLIISIPCLVITYFVYTVLPELKSTHGSILRVYVVILGINDICLLVGYLRIVDSGDHACTFLGKSSFKL